MNHFDVSIRVDTIVAGKFRRYNQWSVWRQLSKPSLVFLNIRDVFFIGIGIMQSFVKLLLWRPDVVFTKGGYVCLPVGLAARALRIPLVIHDSDAHPGLTNRVLGRFASAIATGAPLEYYHYPKDRSRYVGIPISDEFQPLTKAEQLAVKQRLGFEPTFPLVVITGGGLGARRINDLVVDALDNLLIHTAVVLISGVGQYDELVERTPQHDPRFQLRAFVSEGMAELLGAADVVVTRAGATTILELAALAKPTILIPNEFLTGGHQLKNAAVYADKGAVEVLAESSLIQTPQLLVDAITDLLEHPERQQMMSAAFRMFSKPQAAHDMADMIVAQISDHA